MDNTIERVYLPHQQRVIEEEKELKNRLDKLQEFIVNSDVFKQLPPIEQNLMNQQYYHMKLYWALLQERISRF